MEVYRYIPKQHKDIVDSWREHREMSESRDLPKIGYLCFEDDRPLCAVFLRQAEGGLGIIDGLIADPHLDYEARSVAIDAAVGIMLQDATTLGFTKIVAWSSNERVLQRSKRLHFEVVPDRLMVRELNRGESPWVL